ncbi:AMP-binding protein [Rhodococcus wratislaviensis]|uniref:AMP-binding protein n=1 Tax=Rhodococcus wratislaviensis TaxID=44752 RepID=UPI0009DE5051|nr:AMP-binding protein [Rhodococcus wratislaviensis]
MNTSANRATARDSAPYDPEVTGPSRHLTWTDQVARHAAVKPGSAAMRYSGRSLTWSQLDGRSRQLAQWLKHRGIGRGDRVLFAMSNGPEFPIALLSVHHLGAIAVPVNFRLAPPEVEFLASDAAVSAVIVDDDLLALVEPTLRRHPDLPYVVNGGRSRSDDRSTRLADLTPGDRPPSPLPGPASTGDVAVIMYTSGTTGLPKGAMLSFENLLAGAVTSIHMNQLFSENAVRLVTTPFFHIAAMTTLLSSLTMGQTCVVNPSGNFDAETFLDLIETEMVNNVFLVPTQWEMVCAAESLPSRNLSLRTVSWGAAPASQQLLRKMAEVLPGVRIVSTLGQTETSAVTTWISGDEWLKRPGSVGRPVPTVAARVVDADMNDVPVGAPGEIVYRGAGVMQGYWNRPAETEAAFHGGWFHSGDVVHRDEDGYFYVVDRLKDMIISGGENIYPAELESVLAEHPRIREVAVVGKPHPKWGETPIACIVPTDDEPVTHHEVVAWITARLASFKKPSETVNLDSLPRNVSGKVRKNVLREVVQSGVGDRTS